MAIHIVAVKVVQSLRFMTNCLGAKAPLFGGSWTAQLKLRPFKMLWGYPLLDSSPDISVHKRTYAIPLSYRVTTTSTPFAMAPLSSLRAPHVLRVPACE